MRGRRLDIGGYLNIKKGFHETKRGTKMQVHTGGVVVTKSSKVKFKKIKIK
jgi:hypothetical protein